MSLNQRARQPAASESDRTIDQGGAHGWPARALSAAVALTMNLIVLVIGSAAGADMLVQPPGADDATTVGPVSVILTTIVPIALATGLLVAMRNRAPAAWRALAATGLAVGVLSIVLPLLATASGSTKITLVAMHLITGGVWFVVVRRLAGAKAGRA
jgi:hypothetical protein